MPNERPLPLKELISHMATLTALQQKSDLLLALNQSLRGLLAPPLQHQCRVANYRQGILVVEVASGGWHLRLRYEQERLLRALRQQRPGIASIVIKINPNVLHTGGTVPPLVGVMPHSTRRSISPSSAYKIRLLAMRSPAGLRATLLRLAALASA